RAGQADLGHAGADGALAGDERGPPCSAGLLPVPVGEPRPLPGDPVDVRRLVPHDAAVVAARVEPADVVAPDDEHVRLLAVLLEVGGHPLVLPADRTQSPPLAP